MRFLYARFAQYPGRPAVSERKNFKHTPRMR